jgi:hypothetical protein
MAMLAAPALVLGTAAVVAATALATSKPPAGQRGAGSPAHGAGAFNDLPLTRETETAARWAVDKRNLVDGVMRGGGYAPGTAPGATEREPPAGTPFWGAAGAMVHGDPAPYKRCVPKLKYRGVLYRQPDGGLRWVVNGPGTQPGTMMIVDDLLPDWVVRGSAQDVRDYKAVTRGKAVDMGAGLMRRGIEVAPWQRDGPLSDPAVVRKHCG